MIGGYHGTNVGSRKIGYPPILLKEASQVVVVNNDVRHEYTANILYQSWVNLSHVIVQTPEAIRHWRKLCVIIRLLILSRYSLLNFPWTALVQVIDLIGVSDNQRQHEDRQMSRSLLRPPLLTGAEKICRPGMFA